MSDIQDSQKKVVAFSEARDWRKFHTPKDLAAALSIEVAELQEMFLWKSKSEQEATSQSSKQDIANEIADIFNYVLLLCESLDIDLQEALNEKLKLNEQKYPVSKSFGVSTKYTEL